MDGRLARSRRLQKHAFAKDLEESSAAYRGKRAPANCQVAAGFFVGFGLAALGCATGSGPRSIDDSRPAVKV